MSDTVCKLSRPSERAAVTRTPGEGAKTSRVSSALLLTQSDTRLMRLAGEGYEAAFETLVGRYRKPLHRYAQRFLSDALAEDVIQQAFLDLWSALGDGREIRDVRPWLYRVVHNAALNTIRRAGYGSEQLEETLGGGDSPDAVFERSSAMREAFAGLAGLPPQQREAMMHSAVGGHSREQIASALGVSNGAVGQLLHRARISLRSAATAFTPWPVASWAAGGGHVDALTATRVVELTSSTGGGGMADILLKGGAVVAAAALATAPLGVMQAHGRDRAQPPASEAAPSGTELQSGVGIAPASMLMRLTYPLASPALTGATIHAKASSPLSALAAADAGATSAPPTDIATSSASSPAGLAEAELAAAPPAPPSEPSPRLEEPATPVEPAPAPAEPVAAEAPPAEASPQPAEGGTVPTEATPAP